MNMLEVDWFKKIIEEGHEVTLKYHNGHIWYDMNTGAKSELLIRPANIEEDEYYVKTRYDGVFAVSIRGLPCIVSLVLRCMCDRDYADKYWLDNMAKLRYDKVETD